MAGSGSAWGCGRCWWQVILFIGNFAGNANIVKFGGYVGIVTALCAWYASAAGVANGTGGRAIVPVGRALWSPAAAPAPEPAGRA